MKLKNIKKILAKFPWKLLVSLYAVAIIGGMGISLWENLTAQNALVAQVDTGKSTEEELLAVKAELEAKLAEDPYAENDRLQERQDNIHKAILGLAEVFEKRADLVSQGGKPDGVEPKIVELLKLVNDENYEDADKKAGEIVGELVALLPTPAPVAKETNVPTASGPASDGYQRVNVNTSRGTFTIAMLLAPGARAIVDTASDSNCDNDCPVIPLSDYVARNGGFAGINGAYFCPADYASCAGKVNSFDTLAVNGRSKAVINRDNNVYSTVPLVAMYGGSVSFYGQTVQWGVDTSSNGALANYPLLLSGGGNAFDNGSLPAYLRDTKGTRGFIGTKDETIAIGHVFGANMEDVAEVLRTLGLQNAMNLDGGGSSALYVDGGYKVGPGRLLPTAIVLVR